MFLSLLLCTAAFSLAKGNTFTCGGAHIDSAKYYCCNDIPNPHPHGTPACCLGKAFDSDTHHCCGVRVTPIPPGAKTVDCCHDQAYDPNKESCDTETGKLKPFKDESCPRHDTSKLICCGNQISTRFPGTKGCCGNYAFNPKTHHCCMGKSGEEVMYVVNHRPHSWQAPTCCGPELYNADDSLCCQGHIHNRIHGVSTCCGPHIMNAKSQICCDGVVNRKENMHTSCCGDQSYDTDKNICCQGVKHAKLTTGETAISTCCNDKIMNGKHQMCCAGNIQSKLDLNYDCCHMLSYDTQKSICCGGTIFPRSATTTCCGKGIVDLKKGQCCDDDHQVRCECGPKK